MQQLLFTLLFLLSMNLFAQTEIIGYAVDEQGNPLPFATVAIYENGVLKAGTDTDEFGEFIIKQPDFDEVVVSYIGYTKATLNREEVLDDNWVVLKQGIELDEIVVITLGHRKVIRDVRGCGGIIPYRDINIAIETAPIVIAYYPNPTKDFVQVQFPPESKGFVEVISETGAVLARVAVSAPSVTIDLMRFPSGSYFLRHLDEPLVYQLGTVIKVD